MADMVLAVDKINPQVRGLNFMCMFICGGPNPCIHTTTPTTLRINDHPRQNQQPTIQVAARLAGAFSLWRKFEADRRNLMKAQLDRLMAAGDSLSRDTYEIVSQSLVGGA